MAFLVKSYLTNRLQRARVNTSVSSWIKSLLGVSQGSILELLLLKFYINDLLSLTEMTEVCNMLTIQLSMLVACILSLITRLEHDPALAIEWFESNYIKLNQDKCYFLF